METASLVSSKIDMETAKVRLECSSNYCLGVLDFHFASMLGFEHEGWLQSLKIAEHKLLPRPKEDLVLSADTPWSCSLQLPAYGHCARAWSYHESSEYTILRVYI